VILKGKYVTLRPVAPADAAVTVLWRNSARAAFLQRGAQTEEEQRAWIVSHTRDGEFNFIIELHGEPVGMIAVHDINHRNRWAIFGRLFIGEPEKVKGTPAFYEAELLLCDFAFDSLHLHKLHGEIMDGHTGMLRTRLYLGYRQEGVLRDHFLVDGGFKNAIVVSLLESDYRCACRPKLLQMISLFNHARRGALAGAAGGE
jgi:RimJ/RimL family protein N-acetyltransferase